MLLKTADNEYKIDKLYDSVTQSFGKRDVIAGTISGAGIILSIS